MRTSVSNFLKKYERYIVVFAALSLVGVSAYLTFLKQPHEEAPIQEQTTLAVETKLAQLKPSLLRIPAINLSVGFEAPLGVDAEGSLEVPKGYEKVGWYKYGPTPGEIGPAVILGHIDSYKGPAVFYDLRKLKVGDDVFVDREDGKTVTFVVEKIETYPQSDFPTQTVYGNIDYAGLRLITCAGIYNKGTKRFSHNLVVFARLEERVM